MFLDKINKHANRISLNFLSFSGWVVFVVSCCFFWPTVYEVYVVGNGQAGIAIMLYYVPLVGIVLLSVFIVSIILFLENYFGWRIKNNFFLNNGFMKFLRYFGLAYFLLVLLSFIYFMMTFFLFSIIYDVTE